MPNLILWEAGQGVRSFLRGNDVADDISCAVHTWRGFPDLRAVSVDVRGYAPGDGEEIGTASKRDAGASAAAIRGE